MSIYVLDVPRSDPVTPGIQRYVVFGEVVGELHVTELEGSTQFVVSLEAVTLDMLDALRVVKAVKGGVR